MNKPSYKCENGPWPRSWHSPAILTQRTSLSVMPSFGCLSFSVSTSSPAKWHTLRVWRSCANYISCLHLTLWSVQIDCGRPQETQNNNRLKLASHKHSNCKSRNLLSPSCLIYRSLWNCGVSMIFTNSGWSSMCPWMGSLNTWNDKMGHVNTLPEISILFENATW